MSYRFDERPRFLHHRLCATSDRYYKLENGVDHRTSRDPNLWEAGYEEAIARRNTDS